MKRLFFLVICSAVVALGYAAEQKKAPLTEAQKAALREKRMQKTGGIVIRQGAGKVVIVNAQKKYSDEIVQKSLAVFKNALKVNMELRPGTWKFGDQVPEDAKLALYLVDDATLPMSLVAMEAGWGVMNVAPLEGDMQFSREFMRVGIVTFGAACSQYKVSPLQSVSCPKDLDALIGNGITIDTKMAMDRRLEGVGVTKDRMATYRKACEEGWAASPTNDYQKAIWDEVHAIPDKPLTIKK